MYGKAGIYCIRNEKNGKRYVGQTVDLQRRRRQHFAELKAGTHENPPMQADWNAQGGSADFKWEILEFCPLDKLNERELFWINELNTWDPNGYNINWRKYTLPKGVKEKHQGYCRRGKNKKGYGSGQSLGYKKR